MPRVQHGLRDRAWLQTGPVGALDIGVMHPAVLVAGRYPDRQLGPRLDSGRGDRWRVNPRHDGVIGAGGSVAGLQEGAHRGVPTA